MHWMVVEPDDTPSLGSFLRSAPITGRAGPRHAPIYRPEIRLGDLDRMLFDTLQDDGERLIVPRCRTTVRGLSCRAHKTRAQGINGTARESL